VIDTQEKGNRMAVLVETPLRQISITTTDGKSYLFDEYHGFSELTITHKSGASERFESVELEYQDLVKGRRFSWFEVVCDGSVVPHISSPVVSVGLV